MDIMIGNSYKIIKWFYLRILNTLLYLRLFFAQFARTNKNKDERQIVFYAHILKPRMLKMAKGLKAQGYSVVLLCNGTESNRKIASENASLFTEIDCSCNSKKVLLTINKFLKFNPAAYHCFTEMDAFKLSYYLVKFKKYIGKIVVDEYDVYNGMYKGCLEADNQELVFWEKYSLENADGICSRGYEIEYLTKKLQYNLKGRILYFFDYCFDKEVKTKTEKKENDFLSICYVGGLATEKEYPNCSAACLLEIADLCELNSCHLHVYPSGWDENIFAEYIEKDKNTSFFHFHKPLQWERLIDEISQYDYGIHLIKQDYKEKETDGYYLRAKYTYAAVNKYFDYLEASLPSIGMIPERIFLLFENLGVGVRSAADTLDFKYLKENRSRLKENVERAINELSLSKHVPELIDFYKKL